jgi:hypothetical protein
MQTQRRLSINYGDQFAEQLYMNKIKPVYHGEHGLRTLKELARSYLTISKDLTRVMNRLKALYRSWGIPCAGTAIEILSLCTSMPIYLVLVLKGVLSGGFEQRTQKLLQRGALL